MKERILTIEIIKETVKPIAEKYSVDEIYLFGSYARGDDFRITSQTGA